MRRAGAGRPGGRGAPSRGAPGPGRPPPAAAAAAAKGRQDPGGPGRRSPASGGDGAGDGAWGLPPDGALAGGARGPAGGASKLWLELVAKPEHERFDEAWVTVEAGAGGRGEAREGKATVSVRNFKYRQGGGGGKKRLELSAGAPCDGQDGGDVVLVADERYDSLLHLHDREVWRAASGSHANRSTAAWRGRKGAGAGAAPALRIPVPCGTVVKSKRGGQLLGDLTHHGDALLVAAGGRGGLGVAKPKPRRRPRGRRAAPEGVEVIEVETQDWKAEAAGGAGERQALHLLLRVVADIGLVGLPNAGKSSMLGMLTRASPEVANYPFTTIMPNLGTIAGAADDDWGGQAPTEGAVMADLPGLIEGAHHGRGLGRVFLRHLRRTRVICHVVDAALLDPAEDYFVVREELRLYNPNLLARPHVVCLNKADLDGVGDREAELRAQIAAKAAQVQANFATMKGVDASLAPAIPPTAVVSTSAADGSGLPRLLEALEDALARAERDGL